MINQIKTKELHFAWDRYEDKDWILPKLKEFRSLSTKNASHLIVFVLCGFNSTFEQDLDRIYTLREIGYLPFVMLYDKDHIPKGSDLRRLQRWVNHRAVFSACKKFEDYKS